ncbi:MAG: non-canonical purine NTP pyrophosphatase [Vampirovibrionales bacterium]|nr:non-canonical purine NTP pyrophosphatase [Vampirovibrionales bacterium]
MTIHVDPPTITITVATGNAHKLAELKASLTQKVNDRFKNRLTFALESAHKLSEVDESGETFLDNAIIKAQSTPANEGSDWVLAEDTGLIVDALAGLEGLHPFPGVRSQRWLTPALRQKLLGVEPTEAIVQAHRNAAILKLMENIEHRAASFVTALVLYHPASGHIIQTEGRWPLTVVRSMAEAMGEGGFGYDPIVCPCQTPLARPVYQGLTVAQLPGGVKTLISHRALAFEKGLEKLEAFLAEKSIKDIGLPG